MSIEVHIQHPYHKYDKALKVSLYNPKTDEVFRVVVLEPGDSRLAICVHDGVAYKVEEVPSGRQSS